MENFLQVNRTLSATIKNVKDKNENNIIIIIIIIIIILFSCFGFIVIK